MLLSKVLLNLYIIIFYMKKQVAKTMFDTRYISPFVDEHGSWQ